VGVRRRSGQGHARAVAALLSPRVLSVDLAYVRYADVGVALLDGSSRTATLLDLPLTGRPTVEALADWLVEVVPQYEVAGLCIDGPLGWKLPNTDAPHCRRSERQLRAPGKTGLPPDGVKPATYLAFTQFSIALFERLTMAHGFVLPGSAAAPGARFVTESFPTAVWRALGLPPLKGKGRATPGDVAEAAARFRVATGYTLSRTPTHDELQAAVGGIAGVDWASGAHDVVHLAGDPPVRLDGRWCEGYIMVPASRAP
jgi:hypothetical protein